MDMYNSKTASPPGEGNSSRWLVCDVCQRRARWITKLIRASSPKKHTVALCSAHLWSCLRLHTHQDFVCEVICTHPRGLALWSLRDFPRGVIEPMHTPRRSQPIAGTCRAVFRWRSVDVDWALWQCFESISGFPENHPPSPYTNNRASESQTTKPRHDEQMVARGEAFRVWSHGDGIYQHDLVCVITLASIKARKKKTIRPE